ncbi:MAG: hypothetical protein ACYC0J_07580 [Gammaproteobacteria bacterium]
MIYDVSDRLALEIKSACDAEFLENYLVRHSGPSLNPFPDVYEQPQTPESPHPYVSAFSAFVGPATEQSQDHQYVDDMSQQPVWLKVPIVYVYEEGGVTEDLQQSQEFEYVESPIEGDRAIHATIASEQLEGDVSFFPEESEENAQDSDSSYDAGAMKTCVGNWSMFSFHPEDGDGAGFTRAYP